MPRIRLSYWFIAMLTVAVLLISSIVLPAVAQRRSQDIQAVPLMEGAELDVVSSWGGLTPLDNTNNGISIGGQFRHAPFYLYTFPGYFVQFTTEVNSRDYHLLRFQAGVGDGDLPDASLDFKVLQGGSVVKNYPNVVPGELTNDIDLDLTNNNVDNPNNIGVRMDCRTPGTQNGACVLFFIQADLIPADHFRQPSELQGGQQRQG